MKFIIKLIPLPIAAALLLSITLFQITNTLEIILIMIVCTASLTLFVYGLHKDMEIVK